MAASNSSRGTLLRIITAKEPLLSRLVPPYTSSQHKGMMGRVGIVGGSVDYTGAPYYAAMASLRLGGDLAYVFCESSASSPIKSYSPELMVTPWYDITHLFPFDKNNLLDPILALLPRMHSLVLGPGLGRDKRAFESLEMLVKAARERDMPLVVDADGLHFVGLRLGLIRGYTSCVLTPNKAEFATLVSQALASLGPRAPLAAGRSPAEVEKLLAGLRSPLPPAQLEALCLSLDGVTVLLKGASDHVSNGRGAVLVVEAKGSPRRCGGQGDLLAGAIGVAMHWARTVPPVAGTTASLDTAAATAAVAATTTAASIGVGADGSATTPAIAIAETPSSNTSSLNPTLLACALASLAVKGAAEMAFARHRRGTTTPEILECLAPALEAIVPTVVEE